MARIITTGILLTVVGLLAACGDGDKAPAQPKTVIETPAAFVQTPDFSGENAYLHCRNICALGPRLSGSPAYAAQLEYLESHLRTAGWETRRDTFRTGRIEMTNLRAFRRSPSSGTPTLLLSCHIDTKRDIAPDFESADDGASGAAVLLELARVLPPELAQEVELIFLDGEESFAPRMSETDGLYGSRYDVARRGKSLPRYQINLDMVGGRNKTIAPPSEDTSDFMYAQYSAAVRELGLDPERWTMWLGSYMDDHLPYLEAGVDSLNLIAVFVNSSWWHTTSDNMKRICPHSLQESGRITAHLIHRLLKPSGR